MHGIHFMLLECKTLYDTSIHSRNIPQCHKIHLCTTREIEVFYTAIKKKKKKN